MEVELKGTEKQRVRDSWDIFEIMQKIFYQRHKVVDIDKEHFWAISLNIVSKILSIELVSIGSNNRTIAGVSEVLRIPMLKLASQVVLVHNHPSGDTKPSEADITTTRKIMQAALIHNIDIADHVIITQHSYYSFGDSGLLEKVW